MVFKRGALAAAAAAARCRVVGVACGEDFLHVIKVFNEHALRAAPLARIPARPRLSSWAALQCVRTCKAAATRESVSVQRKLLTETCERTHRSNKKERAGTMRNGGG